MVAEQVRRVCLAGYDEGLLKALTDGELSAGWTETVREHAQTCVACSERLARLRLDGALAHGRLALLEQEPALMAGGAQRPAVGALLAQARQESAAGGRWAAMKGALRGVMSRPLGRVPVAAALAAGAVLAAGSAFTQPTVQAFAQGVLQQFRVQKVQPVRIDAIAMPGAEIGRFVEAAFRSGTYSGPAEPKVRPATPSEAATATGVALRGPTKLPAAIKGSPQLWLSDPISFTFTYDGQKLTQAAQEMGIRDQALLAQLRQAHGATARGNIPAAAALVYGDIAAVSPAQGKESATAMARGNRPPAATPSSPVIGILQLRSPTLDVTGNVDLDQLRQQLLRSGLVPASVANQLLAITDWKNTVPFPVVEGQSREVAVDGTTGTLVTKDAPVLIWQQNGIVYAMSGTVSEAELLEAARSLAPVR